MSRKSENVLEYWGNRTVRDSTNLKTLSFKIGPILKLIFFCCPLSHKRCHSPFASAEGSWKYSMQSTRHAEARLENKGSVGIILRRAGMHLMVAGLSPSGRSPCPEWILWACKACTSEKTKNWQLQTYHACRSSRGIRRDTRKWRDIRCKLHAPA